MQNEVTSDIPKCPTETVMAEQYLITALLSIMKISCKKTRETAIYTEWMRLNQTLRCLTETAMASFHALLVVLHDNGKSSVSFSSSELRFTAGFYSALFQRRTFSLVCPAMFMEDSSVVNCTVVCHVRHLEVADCDTSFSNIALCILQCAFRTSPVSPHAFTDGGRSRLQVFNTCDRRSLRISSGTTVRLH